MSTIAIVEAPGSSASTTTALALAALAPANQQTVMLECDPSGGDLAGWAGLHGDPSWSSAVSGADRSWPGMCRHLQRLPSDLHVMVSPSSSSRSDTVVRDAAERFAPMVDSLSDVVAFADCGRTTGTNPWLVSADLVVVLIAQAASAGATVTRIDRSLDLARSLAASSRSVGMVVVGQRPYEPTEIAASVGAPLLGVLADDPAGAALAAGAWTIGKGASRTPLARSARSLSARLVDFVTGANCSPGDVGIEHELEMRS